MISGTKGSFTQINQTIDSISNRVGTAEGDINSLELTATGLTNRISNAEGNVSTLQNTATSLTNRISNAEGDINSLELTSSDLTLKFENPGSQNLLYNSGFIDGGEAWLETKGSPVNAIRYSSSYSDMPSGCATLLKLDVGISNSLAQTIDKGFSREQRTFTVSGYIRNTATGLGTTSPYAGVEMMVEFTDSTYQYFALVPQTRFNYGWEKFAKTVTVAKEPKKITINIVARDMIDGVLFVSSLMVEEGRVARQWSNNGNEAYATTHRFTKEGYFIYDSNGSEIVSITKGIANEQNIGRVDNVESGFPMKIPFNIGTEVSQITQAKLKWDISKFRTYSKGAASGGGTRTTPSGGAGTTGTRWGTTGIAVGTSGTTASAGLPHNHTVSLDDLAHNHSTPAHTHSLDITHEHAPVYGILEPNIVDYVFTVWVDGALRATLNAQRGEVDLSAWITTSGWHEISLQVNNLMRIDANLFLKTYIRR